MIRRLFHRVFVIVRFVFIFCSGLNLLIVLTAIQFRAEPETILARRFEEAASLQLTRGSSWIWGDRAKRCLSERPAPAGYSTVPKIR